MPVPAKPLVSIIIPVFNAERYLAGTITSALNQSWLDREIIVVDDGSTDNSLQIAKSFEKAAVHVITQKQKGASAARNAGLKKASGAFIQFLDADDLLSPNKIESQMQLLNKYPGHLCFSSTVQFADGTDFKTIKPDDNLIKTEPTDAVSFLIQLYAGSKNGEGGSMIQPNAWLTPRRIIDKVGLWNENLTVDDDGEFFCRIILASHGVLCASEGINYYRKHQDKKNLSARLNLVGFESMLNALQLKQKHLTTVCGAAFANQIFAAHYWNIALITYPKFKSLSKQAVEKAKEGNYVGRKYIGGPVSNFLSKILGWKIVRYISFIRYGF